MSCLVVPSEAESLPLAKPKGTLRTLTASQQRALVDSLLCALCGFSPRTLRFKVFQLLVCSASRASPDPYLPFHLGSRFSRNAAIPSRASSVFINSSRYTFSARASPFFVTASAAGLIPENLASNSSTFPST
jgi:hypothetical protein